MHFAAVDFTEVVALVLSTNSDKISAAVIVVPLRTSSGYAVFAVEFLGFIHWYLALLVSVKLPYYRVFRIQGFGMGRRIPNEVAAVSR